MPHKCFYIKTLDIGKVSLRRYASSDQKKCPNHWLHDAQVHIFDEALTFDENGSYNGTPKSGPVPHEDPRWPIKCDHCDYLFEAGDNWQTRIERYYVDDQGVKYTLHEDLPIGAMYDAYWLRDRGYDEWTGPDGLCLHVKTPGGIWNIDSRASNCTMKDDNAHRCWVRHGSPLNPGEIIHVDKNGLTCQAGAGSIVCGNYHGFLHNGYLTDHC
jgi:hypothetical protein